MVKQTLFASSLKIIVYSCNTGLLSRFVGLKKEGGIILLKQMVKQIA